MREDYRKYILLGAFLFLFTAALAVMVSNCMHRGDNNYDSDYHPRGK